jgi:DNA-binding NtrC family response regulator
MTYSILLVGTASTSHRAIGETLRALGYRIVEIDDIDLAPGALNAVKAEVLVLDVEADGHRIAGVAAAARRKQAGLRIIAVGEGDLDAIADGAVDAVIHRDFVVDGMHGLIRELCDV